MEELIKMEEELNLIESSIKELLCRQGMIQQEIFDLQKKQLSIIEKKKACDYPNWYADNLKVKHSIAVSIGKRKLLIESMAFLKKDKGVLVDAINQLRKKLANKQKRLNIALSKKESKEKQVLSSKEVIEKQKIKAELKIKLNEMEHIRSQSEFKVFLKFLSEKFSREDYLKIMHEFNDSIKEERAAFNDEKKRISEQMLPNEKD